jgi:hypothetical protein
MLNQKLTMIDEKRTKALQPERAATNNKLSVINGNRERNLQEKLKQLVIASIKDAYGTYRNWGDSRNATITFSYNFGKTTGKQRAHNSAVETEQNRVK